ncbi:MAG: hypothetical protein MJZ41_10595 [Bacteroidaceae bacterium]|nr:hypothetical protein [Bacteroidaceae bacterium]
MKNLMHILLSTIISLMLVIMGAGIVVVHCEHTGSTRVVSFKQQACKKQCKTTSSCMKTYILKLSTMSQVQPLSLEHNLSVSTLPWLIQPVFEYTNLSTTTSEGLCYSGNHRHGPPRKYLNFICVLLI